MKLTPRELQIKQLLLKGRKGKDIATELNIILQTVKFHVTNIYRKEGVKSKYALLVKELQPGVTLEQTK